MRRIAVITMLSLMMMGQANSQTMQKEKSKPMKQTDYYTFQLSDKVTRQKVTFKNRYGISISADLYLPKNRGSEPLAALAISGPFGAVKEQSSGLYANTMAERGFVTLAFDPSYTGESGGESRNVASPDINTEDFSAAVDYLGLQPSVDRNRIGIIGICGFGGMALNATAIDKRVKAVATTSMYDMSRVMAKGYDDKLTGEQRTKMLEQMSQQRWKDAEKETPAAGPRILPEKLEGNEPQFVKDYFDYYRTPRGFHKNSLNSNGAWTITNALSFMNMPLLTYIKEIAPRPMLLIAGENAHSRYFSEDAYKAAAEPKELMIIPNAVHVDLYDKKDVIPFDKLEAFFKEHLKVNKSETAKQKSTVSMEKQIVYLKQTNTMKVPLIAAALTFSAVIISCKEKTKTITNDNKVESIFPKGELGPAENFSGKAWNYGLVANDSLYNTLAGNVYFEPGARSNWHIHPAGQILIITDGIGYH